MTSGTSIPTTAFFVVVVIALAGCSSPAPEPDILEAPVAAEARIPLTEVRTLQSSTVGRDYKIYIALPVSYATGTSDAYPVVYLLDADLWFGAVADPTRLLHWEKATPEMIVVGIGYGISWDDPDEFQRLRNIDFTPTHVETSPGSGGAGDFLRFIQEDLFPYIDSNYRTDPVDRTIAGLSDGALFSLYALFQAPETFNRYIAVSPHLAWDDRAIFQNEARFAKENAELRAELFLAVGSLDREFASDLMDFHRTLKDRNYGGLTMQIVVMEQETHLSVFPGAFSRGLRAVFQ